MNVDMARNDLPTTHDTFLGYDVKFVSSK